MATTISLAVAIRDETDLASGHKRKKRGDIMAWKPGLWQWGSKEVQTHLIIDLIVPDAVVPKLYKLQTRWFTDGSWEDDIENPKAVSGKRRLNIPVSVIQNKFPAWWASIDWQRVQDPNDAYQPLRDEGRIIDLTTLATRHEFFFDRVRDRLLSQAEVDTELT